MLRYSALRSAKNSIVFDVDLAGVRCLVAIFLWVFRLPQSFCFRDQALQYHALVLVGLFRKQLVKVLHVELSSDYIDYGLHSNEAPSGLLPRI